MYSEQRKQVHLNHKQLKKIFFGCRLNQRTAQKALHDTYFAYAMSIALCYSSNYDDAVEMTNDAFFKIFKHIKNGELWYGNTIASFVAWLKRIVIRSCIGHKRASNKKEAIAGVVAEQIVSEDECESAERFSHAEIAERLNISESLE
ncbi:MAG: hypothetical protein ABI691_18720 [Ginsengibacter sp.]